MKKLRKDFTPNEKFFGAAKNGGLCVYCNNQLDFTSDQEAIFLVRRGSMEHLDCNLFDENGILDNSPLNLAPACIACNKKIGDMSLNDKIAKFPQIAQFINRLPTDAEFIAFVSLQLALAGIERVLNIKDNKSWTKANGAIAKKLSREIWENSDVQAKREKVLTELKKRESFSV